MSIILQKNVLFFGTVRDNLKWGNPEATDEEIWEACRAACADEFLNRMPDGLDTMLEQGAGNLSGGQKQRLCIARALVGKAKILIFDDSTSAVDTATEKKIRIGKSTLLLQVCRNLTENGSSVLYISGEESLRQIKLRANRIGTFNENLQLLCETNLDKVRE